MWASGRMRERAHAHEGERTHLRASAHMQAYGRMLGRGARRRARGHGRLRLRPRADGWSAHAPAGQERDGACTHRRVKSTTERARIGGSRVRRLKSRERRTGGIRVSVHVFSGGHVLGTLQAADVWLRWLLGYVVGGGSGALAFCALFHFHAMRLLRFGFMCMFRLDVLCSAGLVRFRAELYSLAARGNILEHRRVNDQVRAMRVQGTIAGESSARQRKRSGTCCNLI
jgi:hypothetical protein